MKALIAVSILLLASPALALDNLFFLSKEANGRPEFATEYSALDRIGHWPTVGTYNGLNIYHIHSGFFADDMTQVAKAKQHKDYLGTAYKDMPAAVKNAAIEVEYMDKDELKRAKKVDWINAGSIGAVTAVEYEPHKFNGVKLVEAQAVPMGL